MLNKCQFIGNIGKQPEIKTMPSGNQVANFSIACTEKWKDKQTGEPRERTEWVSIVVYNKHLVSICEKFLNKGMKVYIEGEMRTRKWNDQATGQDKYTTEVVLDTFKGEIKMLSYKDDNQTPQQTDEHNTAKADGFQPQPDDLEDEIPF